MQVELTIGLISFVWIWSHSSIHNLTIHPQYCVTESHSNPVGLRSVLGPSKYEPAVAADPKTTIQTSKLGHAKIGKWLKVVGRCLLQIEGTKIYSTFFLKAYYLQFHLLIQNLELGTRQEGSISKPSTSLMPEKSRLLVSLWNFSVSTFER